ncbi:MAG TPA: hypothetical protein VN253_25580 [Kofleriaceae bacterium]|nr:hypothetical protein [Kofleriaceae bacterium]
MRTIQVCLSLLALGGPAFAQATDDPPPPPPQPASDGASAGERVVLPAKRLYARASLELDLSTGTAFDPVSLAPDVFYGVTSAFTVGLVHSSLGGTGLIGQTGSSLCFTGACDGVYHNFGLDGRYQFTTGKISAAASFGLYAKDLSPFTLSAKLGVVGRWRPKPASKLAVDFAPSLFIGITQRDPAVVGAAGNTEVFALPVTAVYAVKPRISVMAQTGLFLPFETAGDGFFVPLSLGGSYAVNKQISVEAAFSLLHLLGGSAIPTGIDARSFTIGGGYAF